LTKVWVSTLKGLFYVESDPKCKGIYVGNGSPNLFIFKIKKIKNLEVQGAAAGIR
jgi:hypothetical protein